MFDLNTRAGRALAGRWRAGMKGVYLAESVAVRVHGVGTSRDPYCDAFALHSCRRFNIPVSRLHDPDLSDPATRGAFLDVVREAWDDEGAYAMPRSVSEGGGWALWACPPGDVNIPRGTGATEAEALVAALESAP